MSAAWNWAWYQDDACVQRYYQPHVFMDWRFNTETTLPVLEGRPLSSGFRWEIWYFAAPKSETSRIRSEKNKYTTVFRTYIISSVSAFAWRNTAIIKPSCSKIRFMYLPKASHLPGVLQKCPNIDGELYCATPCSPREYFLCSNRSIRLEATDWGISCVSHDSCSTKTDA